MRRFWNWVIHVDRILRGETTRLDDFDDDQITFPLGGVMVVLGVLGLIAGGCTGSFAFFSRVIYQTQTNQVGDGFMQLFASGVKVPLLFAMTLLVTFPSLYVFNTLVGAQLKISSLVRLLTAALVVNISVLAAFGPIVTFFAVCTESYHFMILLNVAVFAIAGIIGMTFLVQSLNRIVIARRRQPSKYKTVEPFDEAISIDESLDEEDPEQTSKIDNLALENISSKESVADFAQPITAKIVEPPELGPLDSVEQHDLMTQVRRVFGCWIIIFGLVGAQMAWVLRPFIGDPNLPFAWFRERNSNFFASVLESIAALFGF